VLPNFFLSKPHHIQESDVLAPLALEVRGGFFFLGVANAPLGTNLRGGFSFLGGEIPRPAPLARPLIMWLILFKLAVVEKSTKDCFVFNHAINKMYNLNIHNTSCSLQATRVKLHQWLCTS